METVLNGNDAAPYIVVQIILRVRLQIFPISGTVIKVCKVRGPIRDLIVVGLFL